MLPQSPLDCARQASLEADAIISGTSLHVSLLVRDGTYTKFANQPFPTTLSSIDNVAGFFSMYIFIQM